MSNKELLSQFGEMFDRKLKPLMKRVSKIEQLMGVQKGIVNSFSIQEAGKLGIDLNIDFVSEKVYFLLFKKFFKIYIFERLILMAWTIVSWSMTPSIK